AADLQSGNHGPFLHLRATGNRPSNRVLTSTPTNPTTTALTAASQHRYRPMSAAAPSPEKKADSVVPARMKDRAIPSHGSMVWLRHESASPRIRHSPC